MTPYLTKYTFSRFRDLKPVSLACDMHVHTLYTDGKASIADIIDRAAGSGLNTIAFTEHVRSDSKWFPAFADEVRELGQKSSISILVGAEARIVDDSGALDISESIRKECDIVLGSVHRFSSPDGSYRPFHEVPPEDFPELEFQLAMGYIKHGSGDVLAHPGGMSNKFGPGFPSEMLRLMMRDSSNRGIAIEINSKYILDLKEFCQVASEENPLISIGSDVHELGDLGNCANRLKEFL